MIMRFNMSDIQLIKDISKIVELPYKEGKVKYSGDYIDPLLNSMRAKALCLEMLDIYGLDLIKTRSARAAGGDNMVKYCKDKSINRVILLAVRENNSDKL